MLPYRIVILYSECLASYLLYARLLRVHPEMIAALVRLPTIPQKHHTHRTSALPMIRRLFHRASMQYLLFNFFTISLFTVVARLFGNRLVDIAHDVGVPVKEYTAISDEVCVFVQQQTPALILNNSPNILPRTLLSIPTIGTINYHGAPLPQYRGAGNYFWMLADSLVNVHATVHFVDAGLDTGAIIQPGPTVHITPRMSVFALWYKIRQGAYDCFIDLYTQLQARGAIAAVPQDESKAVTRSFPDAQVVKHIRQSGHPLIRFKEIWKIITIARTRV